MTSQRTILFGTVWLALVAAGCSERKPPEQAAAPPAAAPAPVTSDHEPVLDEAPGDTVSGRLAAGETPAKYVARFEDGQLKSITEERTPPGAAVRAAKYVFYGARLVEFSGVALQSDATIDLRFDMQSGVTAASGSAGRPGDDEISAVRSRAALLRSHALAHRSTRGHGEGPR